MSKAFTREDDEAPERGFTPKVAPVPAGVKNYMTADGAALLQGELDQARQWLAAAAIETNSASDRQRELARQRVATLSQILSSVTVVEPQSAAGKVKFGSWVKVRNSEGATDVYRIVGIHETELGGDWISWISPLAKALMNGLQGETVQARLPRGMEQLEILEVSDMPFQA
jgi:transcription elongation factor GreB